MAPTLWKILAILAHHGRQWRTGAPPADLRIERTHAGHIQRSEGAWSWFLWSDMAQGDVGDIGSQWPASEIARWGPKKTSVSANGHGQVNIDPTPEALREPAAPKKPKALCCPRCGGKGPLTRVLSVANGGALRNDSLWQAQSICAACIVHESA